MIVAGKALRLLPKVANCQLSCTQFDPCFIHKLYTVYTACHVEWDVDESWYTYILGDFKDEFYNYRIMETSMSCKNTYGDVDELYVRFTHTACI